MRSEPIALYVASLNDMIDLHAARIAALRGHVPETVPYLLFGLALGTSALIGYTCGLAGQRSGISTILFASLIVFASS